MSTRLVWRLSLIHIFGTNAREGRGLQQLQEAVSLVADGRLPTDPLRIRYSRPLEEAAALLEPAVREIVPADLESRWVSLRLLDGESSLYHSLNRFLYTDLNQNETLTAKIDEARALLEKESGGKTAADLVVTAIFDTAETIAQQVTSRAAGRIRQWDRRLDRLFTSKTFGIPVMLVLLGVVFWITLAGANYPSQLLAEAFFWLEGRLSDIFTAAGLPPWLHGALISGVYRTLAWVISVMLPPMAIFFPLFTFLEDLGYLPRVAFNLSLIHI